MGTVSGRVVVSESNIGLPAVVVAVHDVAIPSAGVVKSAGHPDLPVAEATAAAVGPDQGAPISLGSVVTDRYGAFELVYDEPATQNGGELKRLALLVSVLAPEQPGSALATRTLFTSPDIRFNAGPDEAYLISIPSDTLTKAGIASPLDPSVAAKQSQSVIEDMKQAMVYHVAVTDHARDMAAQSVQAARTSAQQLDSIVEARLEEWVTGANKDDTSALNIVPPGAPPQAAVWGTVNRTIESTINADSIAGYVVFTAEEADRFRDGSGGYLQHIPADQIEPFIFQAEPAKRQISILRADPLAALCRAQQAPDPLAQPPGAVPNSNGGAPTTNDPPLTPQDLPRFIGRLIAPIVSPEEAGATIQGRPTAADVESSVGGLQLGGGPADVTAFYDFHQLQIAFDYVWQRAIDSGLLETGKILCRKLAARGGDPIAALQGDGSPVAALRDEVRHVAAAQRSLQSAGVLARTAQDPVGNTNGPSTPVAPVSGIRAPIVRPPFVDPGAGDPAADSAEPGDLLAELEEMLGQRYSFEVFAPGSANFGLLVTYRQRWDPITYQVGNLVKTLTLAPRETRKVTSKRTIKVDRSAKSMQDNLLDRRDDTTQTMRDEAEIVQRAQQKTTFSQTAQGAFDVGVASGTGTVTLGRDAEGSSQETKRQFHEAVLKTAQEYRDERKLEVETKTFDEQEATDTVELSNPNDELTVTYLFYELQRRFRVSERIHKLTPVVLVAMDVPNPNRDAIDMVLLSHSWVINRVLLDDRYRPALDYLCTSIVGDEMRMQDLQANVAQVNDAVLRLQSMYRDMQAELTARESALQAATQVHAGAVGAKDSDGLFSEAWDAVVGSSGTDPQAAQILQDAARDSYDRTVQHEKELRMRLDAETAALSAATEAYAKARAEHGDQLLRIAALRAHFKENVLFYMQAIWSFTFQDQTFFSLCNLRVPKLTATQKTYSLRVPAHVPLSIAPMPGQVVLEVDADVQLASGLDPAQDFVTLAEVADLDSPLGFKGNYMIFPLRASNPLTDFMMVPYLDSELGIHDPDELGGWTPEDFEQYARCLLSQQKDLLSASDLAALQSQLQHQYGSIVSNPALATDTVIVPTHSLYIEALPGAHPLLENFKLQHRAVDVAAAMAAARRGELENLRFALRLLNDELTDPDVERQIVVNGAAGVNVGDA